MLNDNGVLIYRDESYLIQGAVFEVYNVMGGGFLESVYQECLAVELEQRKVPFRSQAEIPVGYKNLCLSSRFRADFICFDRIIVELKAVRCLDPVHRAQVVNYLKATNLKLGLLVNFCSYPNVTIERLVV